MAMSVRTPSHHALLLLGLVALAGMMPQRAAAVAAADPGTSLTSALDTDNNAMVDSTVEEALLPHSSTSHRALLKVHRPPPQPPRGKINASGCAQDNINGGSIVDSSGKTCGTCCNTWKNQGKCDGKSTVLGGKLVSTICCATCGTPVPGNSPPFDPKSPPGPSGCPLGWLPAVGTLYDSWPRPGTEECVVNSGCKYAGQFNQFSAGSKVPCALGAAWLNGGSGNMACRWPETKVKTWNIAATYQLDPALVNRQLQIMIEGIPAKTVIVNILDVCADKDCKSCCKKNTGDKKWKLIDLEKWPASALLGFDFSSPKFDINNVNYPTANGKRPGVADQNDIMALCYKDIGPAIKVA